MAKSAERILRNVIEYSSIRLTVSRIQSSPLPTRQLFNCNNRQSTDRGEIGVPAHQRCVERERSRGHPEIIFIQCKAALLACHFDGRVNVSGTLRYRLTVESRQEPMSCILQFGAPFTRRQSGNAKKEFAADDRTCTDTICRVQARHPVLDCWDCSHWSAGR